MYSFVDKFMEEKEILNKRFNLKVSAEILSNKELTLSEKLLLSLDYALSSKRGYNRITNLKVAELLGLHQNIVSRCRISLIKKGYLVKDDKRTYRLTDKLKNVEIPLINGKKDIRTIIIPYEIYSHKYLQSGAKLLFGEYNSMSKSEKGYFSKRDTTSKRMNVSMGSITNWTKELERYDLLDEYKIESGYYTKQKTVRTKEFKREIEKPIDDFDILD
jgi:Mn-dependent DtxR family transcriptional regulator